MARSPLQTLLKNAGILLSGNVVGAGLTFLASMLVARTLGPREFGEIALVQSVVYAVDRLLNMQSWRTLIRFGADALEKEDDASFRQAVSFGVCLDVLSAFLGAAVSLVAVHILSARMEWAPELTRVGYVYAAIVALHLTGVPIGLLRLFDRFGDLARHRLVTGSAKLIGAGVALSVDPRASTFLAVWVAVDLISWGVLAWLGWRAYRGRGYEWPSPRALPGVRARFQGIVSFSLLTNLTSSVRAGAKELDQLLVGVLLSPDALGLYRVARQFGGIVSQLQDPLVQSVYPELARRVAARDAAGFLATLKATAKIAMVAAPIVWLGIFFFGETAIRLTAGPEFVGARVVLVIYLGALCYQMGLIYLQSSLLALGNATAPLWASVAGTTCFLASLPALTARFGVAGAGWGHVVFYLVWSTLLGASLIRSWRRWRRSLDAPAPGGTGPT